MSSLKYVDLAGLVITIAGVVLCTVGFILKTTEENEANLEYVVPVDNTTALENYAGAADDKSTGVNVNSDAPPYRGSENGRPDGQAHGQIDQPKSSPENAYNNAGGAYIESASSCPQNMTRLNSQDECVCQFEFDQRCVSECPKSTAADQSRICVALQKDHGNCSVNETRLNESGQCVCKLEFDGKCVSKCPPGTETSNSDRECKNAAILKSRAVPTIVGLCLAAVLIPGAILAAYFVYRNRHAKATKLLEVSGSKNSGQSARINVEVHDDGSVSGGGNFIYYQNVAKNQYLVEGKDDNDADKAGSN